MLAIHDHIGIQKLKISEYPEKPPKRDTQVLQASEVAYKRVGLVQHEKKRKRNLSSGILLGADFDSLAGRVMAPRNRIGILRVLMLAIVKQGTCTPKLLSVLMGCWIHVLLFRRVLFSVYDQLFREGQGKQPHEVFCLFRQARSELQLIACLGPLAQSD